MTAYGGIREETNNGKTIFSFKGQKATVAPVKGGFRIKLPGKRIKYHLGITQKGANRRARKAVKAAAN